MTVDPRALLRSDRGRLGAAIVCPVVVLIIARLLGAPSGPADASAAIESVESSPTPSGVEAMLPTRAVVTGPPAEAMRLRISALLRAPTPTSPFLGARSGGDRDVDPEPAEHDATGGERTHRLTSLFAGSEDAIAFIDGKPRRIGDALDDGASVVSIDVVRRAVALEYPDGRRVELCPAR